MWDLRPPAGQELLDRVRASLPPEPLRIEAELRTKEASGDYAPVARAEVQMWMDGGYGEARYIVRDWFGREEEELTVVRREGVLPTFAYRTGDPLQDTPLPDLSAPIRNTDLTWGDLSLSFLWWPGAKTVGQESVRGRNCYIVEVPAPAEHFDSLERVRIWIDPKIGMLLRAEAIGSDGTRLRTMDARKFRKIDEIWMISNLEVTRHPGRHRTSMVVKALSVAGTSATGTLTADDSDVLE